MKKIIPFIFLFIFLFSFSVSFAQQKPTEAVPQEGINTSFFNIWTGTGGERSGGNGAGQPITPELTCNTLGYTCTICDALIIVTNVIKLLLDIGIMLAVVIILYGGVRFMTAGGSEQQVSGAKDIIKKALIGLVLVAGAWFIVNIIFTTFTSIKWNEVNPLNCPKSKLDVWDLKKNAKETNNNNSGNGTGNNTITKENYFSAPAATPEDLKDIETLKEGTEVAPITECPIIQEGNTENFFQYVFSTPQKAEASTFGNKVITYASRYLGKLKYSNDAKARRDPDGKTVECQNLIQGTNYTGCADCSGFAFKMFTCVLGEDIGQRVDDQTEMINSGILKNIKLPSGFERYLTSPLSAERILDILSRGDVIGYDVGCNKKYNSKAKMGHVMLFDKIVKSGSETYIQMIDQGSSGGAKKRYVNGSQMEPFLNCGYIIHITD